MRYLLNAISPSMFSTPSLVEIYNINIVDAKKELAKGFHSAVGHQPTADFLSELLEIKIPFNREEIRLKDGDIAIIASLSFRLPEGYIVNEKELTEFYNAGKIKFYLLKVKKM